MFWGKLYIAFLLSFFIACAANAQVGDSLVIHFKNGTSISIALADIRKITFDSLKESVSEKINSSQLNLLPSFPNPSQSAINIPFEIATSGKVIIAIYDSKGDLLRTLQIPNAPPGKNQIEWDGLNSSGAKVPNGEYFYEVKFKDEALVKKMIMIK